MKGAVFSGFTQFIEQEFGLSTWLQLVEDADLASEGLYIATEIYQDDEFTQIINQLVKITSQSRESLERKFGVYFFPTLFGLAAKMIPKDATLFEFLISVDKVIHREVQKADPLAYTPSLYYDKPQEDVLIMRYKSSRKMCYFAEGLIIGAANHFGNNVQLSQSECMCKGDEHCLIKIEMK